MNNSKALAGGLAAAVTTVVMYFVHMVPVVAAMPANVDTAVEFIVGSLIGYLLVYYAPPNTPSA